MEFKSKIAKIIMIPVLVTSTFDLVGLAAAEYVGSIEDGLYAPTCVDANDDRIAILEPFADQITVFSADGRITGKADIAGKASGLERYSENTYIFCDRTARQVIAADISNSSTRLLFDGRINFQDPVDILMNSANCFILDAGSKEIIAISSAGDIRQRIILNRPEEGSIGFPSSFVFNQLTGKFYILDQLSSEIWIYTSDGEYAGHFCSFGGGEGQISRGGDLACDPDGNILVSDRYQGRILIFSPAGEYVSSIDLHSLGQSGLGMPSGIEVDEQGFLYIAETEGRKVHIFHLGRTANPERALAATQVYPAANDTLAISAVRLVALLDGHNGQVNITGFDFQLFASTGSELPITEIFNLAPGEISEELPESDALAAEWQPDPVFNDNSFYEWRVRARNGDIVGEWTSRSPFFVTALPLSFSLSQNYPNPFNPVTHIAFDLPVETGAVISIYDMLGKLVWVKSYDHLQAGSYRVTWDGRGIDGQELASGIYFYRLTTESFNETKKMVLLK